MYLCSMTHSDGILQCLTLAKQGGGYVHPNPWVGCVIVAEGRILAEGYHKKAGQAHAEVEALRAVAPEDHGLLPSATLYVNLEPCSHQGKTPPCAEAIIESGIRTVVVGTLDPNPLVAGQGIQKMRDAGIDVTLGIEEAACAWVNRRFFHSMRTGMPYIILKWAQSPDGFIDGLRTIEHPGPHRISNPESQVLVHQWRSEEAGVLVGWGTYMADDSQLTVREVQGAQPQRILWSSRGPWDVEDGWKLWAAKKNPFPWKAFERFARESGLRSILVEGGGATLQALINQGLWNEIRILHGSQWIEEGVEAPKLPEDLKALDKASIPGDWEHLPDHIGDNRIDIYVAQPTFL